MSFFLIIPVVIVLTIHVVLTVLRMMRPRNAPPNAHIGMPIIGTYLEIAKNPVSFIKQCYDKYGEVYTTPMMHKNLTFLIGPEASTPFFKSNDEVMSQNEVYGFMKPVFGPNIVYDAEPKKRTQQMQHTAGALRSARLKIYVPKIERETIEYLKRWGESGEVNLLDALSELTIMSASRCLHGDEVRENMFDEVSRIYCDLDKGITPISFFFPTVPIPSHIRRDRARVEMVKIFSKVIKDRRAKCGNTDDFTDILQVFIDLEYKDGSRLIDDEIVGLLIALLFAGQHTSSITSTWTTMFLLFNKKCLEKVMEEQRVVLPDLSASLDFELVGKMEYLQNCVKETLRMYPPLIMLMRYCKQDIETTSKGKTYTIPKGDIVITSPAVSGRLPEVFKDPDSFDPDRFSPERNEQKTPYSYLGFGGGMHACLGQQFGLLQVKTLMSVMLRNFDIEPVDKEFPEPDYTAMVVGPHTHLMVRYKKKPGAFI